MGLTINYLEGQTPLDDDECEGLKINSITTRKELDELEDLNIQQAQKWLIKKRKLTAEEVLSEDFVRTLHKRMYGDVWDWAGRFRKTEKNIGVPFYQIREKLHILLEDATVWINQKAYLPDEIAIRVKHRIVAIHCFPNGNGRHSRMMGDILTEKVFGREPFT
jgi:Fic-DOC domain mobile mystery protein B